MPYAVRKKGAKYKVVNVLTGRVASKGTTKTRAKAQRRLLEGVHRGWKPTGKRRKSK